MKRTHKSSAAKRMVMRPEFRDQRQRDKRRDYTRKGKTRFDGRANVAFTRD